MGVFSVIGYDGSTIETQILHGYGWWNTGGWVMEIVPVCKMADHLVSYREECLY